LKCRFYSGISYIIANLLKPRFPPIHFAQIANASLYLALIGSVNLIRFSLREVILFLKKVRVLDLVYIAIAVISYCSAALDWCIEVPFISKFFEGAQHYQNIF